MLEKNLGSSEADPLARAFSLDGPSVPRGLPVGVGAQRSSAPPGAPAVVPSPSTSPSVLVVSSNLERSRPRRSSSGPEVLGPSISMSILAGGALQPRVPPGTYIVPINPEQSLPRSFPGGRAAADSAASVFKGLVFATGKEHSSPSVQAGAGSSK